MTTTMRVFVDGRQTLAGWHWWDEGIDDLLIGIGKDYPPIPSEPLYDFGAEILDLEGIETEAQATEADKFVINEDELNGKSGGEMTVSLYGEDAEEGKVRARLEQWAKDHNLRIRIQ